jgi:MFS family permease
LLSQAYFSVGFTNSFILTPLNIYLVHTLNAEPQMQTTIAILSTLPWSLKLIFGFISDVFPIFGLHRKPYLTIGAIIYSVASVLYAMSEHDNILLLAASQFISTIGMIMLDVMADTMVGEIFVFTFIDFS